MAGFALAGAVRQYDPYGAHHHPGDRQMIEPLPEQQIGEQRGGGRHQVEQAGETGRRRSFDQPVHQRHRGNRQDDYQPGDGEDQFTAPMDDACLEGEGRGREQAGGADILHRVAGAPVDAAAIALLIQRTEGNTEQRDEARRPAQRRARSHDAVIVQHHQHADETERQTQPLQRRHALAQEAAGDGRGQDRLQPRDQRRYTGWHALADGDEHAAEIGAVHERTGDQTMADSGRAR